MSYTDPCVCVQTASENHTRYSRRTTKPQEETACVDSHTTNAVAVAVRCCCVVSQSNVSCCKRSDNLTLDLTLQSHRPTRGVVA